MSKVDVVEITKKYYDSKDADEFYFNIWGGEDIHVGIYNHEKESIFEAGQRTIEKMISVVTNMTSTCTVLDIGSGYGGAARYLAKKIGCQVQCLNLSEKENERNQTKNEEQNLSHLISVTQGNFEELPFADNSFDIVWSEDAILHSANKEKVFQEVCRVLNAQGQFIFTDPMQNDNCPPGVLHNVLARIHLDSLGSFRFYEELAVRNQLAKINIIDMSSQLVTHYSRVYEELQKRYDEIIQIASKEYVDRMLVGLQHWINAGKDNYLAWGILHFSK